MHELSIASYLLSTVEEQAQQSGAGRVVAINLLIGERAGVVDDSLRFSFNLLAQGTPAEGAQIVTRRTPMRFECAGCADSYAPEVGDFHCPRCGVIGYVIDDASQLVIESIDFEEAGD
jgi:hydrogenase nickel incorporation protein HypA/HybF